MKKALFYAVSVWCAVIIGMEIQAKRDREDGTVDDIPWSSYYEDATWNDVVERMDSSNSNDLRLSSIVAREGYRLGHAAGEARAMAAFMEASRGRD